MARKKKVIYDGYLVAKDMGTNTITDPLIAEYWSRVKNNLFILGDPENGKITFLNREFKKLTENFEGNRVKITIEPVYDKKKPVDEGLPDLDEEYKGFEKFKRTVFTLFKIT